MTKQEALVPKGNWNLSQHRASDIICTAILPTHFFCICVFIQFIFWFPFAKFASETSLSWFLFWNQSPATSSNWIRTKKREQAKKDKLNVWEMSAKPMCPQAWNWSCWWLQGKIFHFSSTLQHVKGKASKHFRKKILIKANFKLEPLRPKLGQASYPLPNHSPIFGNTQKSICSIKYWNVHCHWYSGYSPHMFFLGSSLHLCFYFALK